MMTSTRALWVLLLSVIYALAQEKKQITLEDIWSNNTFQVKGFGGFQWMKTGGQYAKLVQDEKGIGYSINVFDAVSEKKLRVLLRSNQLILKGDSLPVAIEEYSFSQDETKLLIKTKSESIYRYSSKAVFYVFEIGTGKVWELSDGTKVSYAEISPDGSKVAYCKENNLYYVNLSAAVNEIKITDTGQKNKIINGSSDWVYEEEFELVKAFFWSPDSKRLAYYTFDETDVKEYNMQMWGKLYPADYKFKYPKAGEKNSEIAISVYELESRSAKVLFDGKGRDIYIPRINWTNEPNLLSIRWMNRFQDTLKIFHVNCISGKSSLIKTFADPDYIELDDNFQYLTKSEDFICTSEEDGYRHIYKYDMHGKLLKQITKGSWEVSGISGVDEINKRIFYTSREVSSIEQNLYSIDFDGNNKIKLTLSAGVNQPELNPSYTYFVNSNTAKNSFVISLHSAKDGKLLKMLENNNEFRNKLDAYALGNLAYGEFTNATSDKLNYWLIKPVNFDSSKKYPVLMFVYGGPGSQEVLKLWNRKNYLWFQMLAEKGYVIACIDNRGTGGKGAKFKKCTTKQLGKLETEDQIEFAKYLGSMPYVDKSRIGIWGWSYGGYMSTLCLLLGNDVFKLGIAVAPVTSWRFYDSIYTERYLKTPQDNTSGYDLYSPIKHADKLKGKYLLVHGTGDDNVHFQNAIEMQDALIKAGKQFDSFFYPNKSHGISGGNTRLHLYRMMTEFLDKNL